MKFSLLKNEFLDKLSLVSRFTSSRLSSITSLQGILIEVEDGVMHFYATDLNSYLHTSLPIKTKEKGKFIIEPKKIMEFVSLIPVLNLDFAVDEKQIVIRAQKTQGAFPLIGASDFPMPPKVKSEKQSISKDFIVNTLPLVIFSASSDETRPVLTGVNFLATESRVNIVATDGFRLSLMKVEKNLGFPALIIPSDFLSELIQFLKTKTDKKLKDISFGYSKEEKIIYFQVEDCDFYSRLIEGEFPPFEKVIPQESRTKITVNKEEFLRSVKLISVFARDYSNIVIFDVKKDGLYMRPRVEGNQEDDRVFLEAQIEGEEQKIAFNFRFVLDLLNRIESDKVIMEILRSDAPAIFRMENNLDFMHLIMPVRIEVS